MRGPRALILLLGLFLVRPVPARAEWTEDRPADLSRYSLESIEFEGHVDVPESDLRHAIKSSTSGLLRFRPVDVDRIDGDVVRLRNHLRRYGYWNALVERRLLFDPEKRHMRAIFILDPGPQRKVGTISVRGNLTYSEEEILSWTTLRPGDPFDIVRTDADRTTIENTYANRGFYQVQVVADIQPARPSAAADTAAAGPAAADTTAADTAAADTTAAPIVHDLIYRVEEGPRFFVRAIDIEGNRVTRRAIILRELTVGTGDVMSRDALSESRSRLYATGYFERVDLVPQDPDPETGTVDLLVRVRERQMRFVGAGVGYGTRDQLRISAEWGHRNLFGRGKRATVRGLLATELFPIDLVRGRIEGRYVEPWLFGTRTQGTAELYYERSRERFNVDGVLGEYDLGLVSLALNANRRITRFTRTWLTLQQEWADVDPGAVPPPDNAAPDVTRSVSLTVERDRRDDYFEPHRGFLNRAFGRLSGGPLGGDNDFWKTYVESSWYRRAGTFTLAGRLRVGTEAPFGKSDIIPDRDRFKLGGALSVRGYAEQEIGPGDFMMLGNVELRFPIVWILDGALFMDGGNAWESWRDVRLVDFRFDETKSDPAVAAETEVRYSAGAGIRLATPVGPVRLDWGRKIKILPVPEGRSPEDKWRIHLSLGHVF